MWSKPLHWLSANCDISHSDFKDTDEVQSQTVHMLSMLLMVMSL